MSNKSQITKKEYKKKVYEVDENPLLTPGFVPIKRRKTSSKLAEKPLADVETGEVVATSVVHVIEEHDEENFTKIYLEGLKASYNLTAGALKLFQQILIEYNKMPMYGGYVDCVHLAWFDGGLCGRDVGFSNKTFYRCMKELVEKRFLYPRSPNIYWVNPSLFFRGNRVLFVRDLRKNKRIPNELRQAIREIPDSTEKESA